MPWPVIKRRLAFKILFVWFPGSPLWFTVISFIIRVILFEAGFIKRTFWPVAEWTFFILSEWFIKFPAWFTIFSFRIIMISFETGFIQCPVRAVAEWFIIFICSWGLIKIFTWSAI